jgi:putative methionine-R-sulfoxide reductase with GAF domain
VKIEYHLEIYEPNDSSCVAAAYQGSTPFMSLRVGDAIHGGSMNNSDTHKSVRIKDIQHIFWEIEGSHTAHKICVFTEPLPQA